MNRQALGYLGCVALLIALMTARSGAQVFEEETSVLLVEVPVLVLVGSRPVRELTQESFEVYDDGERQEIIGFDVLDLSAAPAGEQSAAAAVAAQPPASISRNFLFVIDFAYPGSWDPVYGAGPITAAVHGMADTSERVSGLLAERFHPTDRLAIAYLSPLRGFKLLQGWTSDREEVARALEILRAASEIRPQRIRELWSEWAPRREATGAEGESDGLWATLEDLIAESRTAGARADPYLPHRDVVEDLADGLMAAGRELGEASGPRHVVYLSTGFPQASLQDLQRLFREFRRTHWSIQAVNTGGLGWGSDSLFLLAHETGGQLFTNSNHVDVLLGDMADETAVTYVLSFQAEAGQRKGSLHKLRVKLVNGPKGARLVHRRGYYSPGSADEEKSVDIQ